jgi:hypothetical protein
MLFITSFAKSIADRAKLFRRVAVIAVSSYRRLALSPYRRVAPSPHRRVAVSPHRRLALSPYRPIALSPYRPIALSPYRRIALSPYRPVALSPSRPVALSPCRRYASRLTRSHFRLYGRCGKRSERSIRDCTEPTSARGSERVSVVWGESGAGLRDCTLLGLSNENGATAHPGRNQNSWCRYCAPFDLRAHQNSFLHVGSDCVRPRP